MGSKAQRYKCPYCGRAMVLRRMGDHYAHTPTPDRQIWVCTGYPGCNVYIQADMHGRPRGRPADFSLRDLRRQAHESFNLLYDTGLFRDVATAYAWLSEAVPSTGVDGTHIRNADEYTCLRIKEASEKLLIERYGEICTKEYLHLSRLKSLDFVKTSANANRTAYDEYEMLRAWPDPEERKAWLGLCAAMEYAVSVQAFTPGSFYLWLSGQLQAPPDSLRISDLHLADSKRLKSRLIRLLERWPRSRDADIRGEIANLQKAHNKTWQERIIETRMEEKQGYQPVYKSVPLTSGEREGEHGRTEFNERRKSVHGGADQIL